MRKVRVTEPKNVHTRHNTATLKCTRVSSIIHLSADARSRFSLDRFCSGASWESAPLRPASRGLTRGCVETFGDATAVLRRLKEADLEGGAVVM